MKAAAILIVCLAGISTAIAFNWHLAATTLDISPIPDTGPTILKADGAPSMRFEPKGTKLFQANARPLFSPGRRPWIAPVVLSVPDPATLLVDEPVAEDTVVTELAPPETRLIGIQKTPAGSMALLIDQSGAAPSWVKIGATYKDWQVDEITVSSVRLVNGKSTVKLELYPEPAQGTVTP